MKIFTGNATPKLAFDVAQRLGVALGKADVGHFSDGEISVEIKENVRGAEAFILQSTCAPACTHILEVIFIADALRRASASSITAVIPYFGYARQDRRVRSARVPISAKVIADMMQSVGITRLITVDLHADQIQGFFYIPVDNVYASTVMLEGIKQDPRLMVVSPDVGGVVRARAVAKRLNDTELAIIDKRRPESNQSKVMNIIGDVSGRHCVLVDDIVDTAGTLCQAADALKDHGAQSVIAYCTHPILSGNALDKIQRSNLDELIVSNTIPLTEAGERCDKIRQIDLSEMLAETIHRVIVKASVSSMFSE